MVTIYWRYVWSFRTFSAIVLFQEGCRMERAFKARRDIAHAFISEAVQPKRDTRRAWCPSF